MRVCTVQEMRECDRRATESLGLSTEVLMENAGHAVCDVAAREFGTSGRRFVVLCGGGNNGGDGLVAARLLHSRGVEVKVYALVDEGSIEGAALANLQAARHCGVPVERLHSVEELCLGRPCDVVIDAIFGTGLSRSPEGLHSAVMERLNQTALPVLAVDIPSGVNGDTGATAGPAVRAACTVTFGAPKRGNLLCPGRELCGKLYVSRISFPPWLYDSVGEVVAGGLEPLPVRPMEAHKGMFGDVLFVAGARSYLGAPYFAVMSFLRAGGGYARLATPQSLVSVLGAQAREAVLVPLDETDEGTAALSNVESLRSLANSSDMMVIGPGVSLNEETQKLVCSLVSSVGVPVLVDGDGLTAVARDAACVRGREAPTVLTPHLGEMARLLHCTVAEVERDRVAAVQRAVREYGSIVLLKGASTLVGGPHGMVYLNLSGNPGMATAGCGDVLSGTIAAVRCAGLQMQSAAQVGAFIHGLSGDLAAEAGGQDGVIARDVVQHLPPAVKMYRERFHDFMNNHYGRLSVI